MGVVDKRVNVQKERGQGKGHLLFGAHLLETVGCAPIRNSSTIVHLAESEFSAKAQV